MMDSQKSEILEKVKRVRPKIAHLFAIDSAQYWRYLLFTATLSWFLLGLLIFRANVKNFDVVFWILTLAAGISTYHGIVFIHEISHSERRDSGWFFWIWNVVIGCPFMVPSFIYSENHLVHHGKKYGTPQDPEYISFQKHPLGEVLLFLGVNLFIPFGAVLRFLILAPLSWVVPPLREFVLSKASTLGMRVAYESTSYQRIPERTRMIQEFISFAWLAVFIGLIFSGVLYWATFFAWAQVICLAGALNFIRVIAVTHKYKSWGENVISWEEQIEDSVEIQNRSLATFLFCPVATQYHMTHHLFPGIPFHNLKEARSILVSEFPKNSFYFKNVRKGVWDGLVAFYKDAVISSRGESLGRSILPLEL